MNNPSPLIVDIKGNALDDGPGIRTVVFFKGCPLDCLWCHNPESKRPEAELMFDPARCIMCGQCEEACPEKAVAPDPAHKIDREKCVRCFSCATQCPSRALRRIGEAMDAEAVVARIETYTPFYEASGGGVTFSGGEPTLFMAYLSEVARAVHAKKIHTLLETCGWFDYPRFEKLVLPYVDSIYMDIKFIDAGKHKFYCGRDNNVILDNFLRLQRHASDNPVTLLPRVPLIPRITDTRENIQEIAAFLSAHGVTAVALLPNNPLWLDKYLHIGGAMDEEVNRRLTAWLSREELEAARLVFRASGIEAM